MTIIIISQYIVTKVFKVIQNQGLQQGGNWGDLPWAPPYSNRTVTLVQQSVRHSIDKYTEINC